MNEPAAPLTMTALTAMGTEVGTETGPGATTKAFNRTLIEAFRANGGVLPGELQRVDFLLLTTTGAKSGAKRVTPLVYRRTGGRLIIIASTGGGPRNPAWFDNLIKDPSVTVELGTDIWQARAVVLADADRDAVFADVVAWQPTFGSYQARTERRIPVVELLPGDA